MARHYQPKSFFRHAPNRLLNEYFSRRSLLAGIDFAALPETRVDPIYDAWLKLPVEDRDRAERDFQDIEYLATEAGSNAILDEGRTNGEDLAPQFASLSGFCEHAFWTFLERNQYWKAALAFHRADDVAERFWRKRKNIPKKPVNVTGTSIQRLERRLGEYFNVMQGRGRNCKVDYYRRNELDCFFAYPQDYARTYEEWIDRDFERRSHHPAFEVIFVYSQADGALDTYLAGDRKPVADLQAIFADVVLDAKLGPDEKDDRIYDLSPLRSRSFQFTYGPDSGIFDVTVKRFRLLIPDKKEQILLQANPRGDKHSIFNLLDKVTAAIRPSQALINLVGITVTFSHNPRSRRPLTRSFDIAWPYSCSLKHDGRDLIIRRMLADSGIETQQAGKGEHEP